MVTDAPQRIYRAPCPGCGAPVEFRSAQSTHAVCGYCQSTVVRSGDKLARLGKMAELFDDHSPLQLQASGSWRGQPFTLVGRLQYKSSEGNWSEWRALLADGSTAWLSEDNGAYVFTTPYTSKVALPAAEHFRLGRSTVVDGQTFQVAANIQTMLLSAQGELPKLPALGQAFALVELRSAQGEVLTIDYASAPPGVSRGSSVQLDDLQLSGLKTESAQDEKARQFACPNCAAQLTVMLATSKSLTCSACNSLIDLTTGIGSELRHAIQDEPVTPLIALGSVGKLEGSDWQVVGFQHRLGHEPGQTDEHFGWEEYLLYNQRRGFVFLVDSVEGWSLVRTATGAPTLEPTGNSALYRGTRYALKEAYDAQTTYVAGEFYWQVVRGQKTSNRDYAAGKLLLSQEQSGAEVVWSSGSRVDADLVAKAFRLDSKKDLFKRGDVLPLSAGAGVSMGTVIVLFVIIVLFLALLSRCSDCDPNTQNCAASSGYRSSGGSFGGFSSGGGHK